MNPLFLRLTLAVGFLFCCLGTFGADAPPGHFRFPPPEFESGYKIPGTTTPAPRALVMQYVDVGVLIAALGLATYLTLRKRSRKAIAALSLFSLFYFGFYREGCICAIGSVQNVALALFDSRYAVPLSVLIFCLAPLIVALFAGRSFCAAVCPHGAIQDFVLLKPKKLPLWLEHALGVIPYLYLGTGVLFAAVGSGFFICRYDPFVAIFRRTGSVELLLTGAAFLVVGIFVGRPYCRFLCPYGALLKVAAAVSKWRVRVTPDYCTQCRLCENSCPFNALREPLPAQPSAKLGPERKRLVWSIVLLPILIVALGWTGSQISLATSKLHPQVSLAEKYIVQQKHPVEMQSQSPEALRLKRVDGNPVEFVSFAVSMRARFNLIGWLLGGWAGLVIGAKLISISVRKMRSDYEPDRGACFSCGRCFEYCPNEMVRRGILPASALDLVAAKDAAGETMAATGRNS